MGNYNGPWGITFNPFLIAQAGRPYNVTSPYDLTGDNFFNDRPSYTSASADDEQCSQNELRNAEPCARSRREHHSRFARQQSVVGRGESARGADLRDRPQGGDRRAARNRVDGRRRRRRRWLRRRIWRRTLWRRWWWWTRAGRSAGGANANNKKYSLNFNVQALNLFNDIDLGTPVGGIQPTFNSEYGALRTGSAVRQVGWPGRKHLLHQLGGAAHLFPGGVSVLEERIVNSSNRSR